jgi:hypothetical protein
VKNNVTGDDKEKFVLGLCVEILTIMNLFFCLDLIYAFIIPAGNVALDMVQKHTFMNSNKLLCSIKDWKLTEGLCSMELHVISMP